jgi:transcription-repair coupling factor (superfamily II helicase)
MHHKNPNFDTLKEWIEEGVEHMQVTGLSGTATAYFLAQLLTEFDRPSLFILPQAKDASRFYRELEFFLPESYVQAEPGQRRLYDFPIYDISPLSGLSPHPTVVTRRLQALYTLTAEQNPIVITSIEAILFRILPKESMTRTLEFFLNGFRSTDTFAHPLWKKEETILSVGGSSIYSHLSIQNLSAWNSGVTVSNPFVISIL